MLPASGLQIWTRATAQQQGLIDRITEMLTSDPEIEAAWLAGSFARGTADEFSDVDVVALVKNEAPELTGSRYASDQSRVGDSVLIRTKKNGRLVNVITRSWDRYDLRFVAAGDLIELQREPLLPLFGASETLGSPEPPPVKQPDAAVLSGLVTEFFRVLGLTVVVVGREEWLVGQAGAHILRQLTLDLFLTANGLAQSELGGTLHLNKLLTVRQREKLEALPPAAPDRQSLIDLNAAIAAIFVPAARRIAAETGAVWPEALEAATAQHLLTAGVIIPWPN